MSPSKQTEINDPVPSSSKQQPSFAGSRNKTKIVHRHNKIKEKYTQLHELSISSNKKFQVGRHYDQNSLSHFVHSDKMPLLPLPQPFMARSKNTTLLKNMNYSYNTSTHRVKKYPKENIKNDFQLRDKINNNKQNITKRPQSRKNKVAKCDRNELLHELELLTKNKHSNNIESISAAMKNVQFDPKKPGIMFDVITSINKAILFSKEIIQKQILKSMCSENLLKAFQLFLLQCAQNSKKVDCTKEKFNSSIEIFLNLSELSVSMLSAQMLALLKRPLLFINYIICSMDKGLYMQEHYEKTGYIINMIKEKNISYELEKRKVTDVEIAEVKAMSVLPTHNDIFAKAPKLKKNIIEGSYQNADHYVTVQFKLLHEDFVAPLREGIKYYLHDGCVQKNSGIAIYKHVKILEPSIESGKFGHVVQLAREVDWAFVSKFFIYGSLLLFTSNDFESFFLGSVITVDNKRKAVVVTLNKMYHIVCKDIYVEKFTMVASKVFFEPYFHVLSALQSIKSDEFPMERYIVQTNQDTKPPSYLKDQGISSYSMYELKDVSIMEPTWPEISSVNLNQSQLKALQAALTNEFVVIQGPPGTGKTFIAHEIVKILLDNLKSVVPILVVCYKNHALDQFLEGILENTKNIVRIGGRSESQQLEEFNIKHYRKDYSYGYAEYVQIFKSIAKSYFQANYSLNGLKLHGIVSLGNLLPYISCSSFRGQITRIDYVEWLMEGAHIDQEIDVLDQIEDAMCFYENDQLIDTCSGDMKINNDDVPSDESRKRMEQNYLDDYGDIYNDVLKEVEHVNCNDKKAKTSTARCNDQLLPEFTITIRNFKEMCEEYKDQIKQITDYHQDSKMSDRDILEDKKDDLIFQYNKNITYIQTNISFLKRMLSKRFSSTNNEINKLYKLGQINIWSLTTHQRWMLYHSWLSELADDIKKQMIELEEMMREEEESLEKARNRIDLKILKKSKVVGITTTAAAKLRPMLNELGPKIVVVEEAAEVLESHIVTALSNKCQHLIIIGDHKQLRPNPAVYSLCRKFNFDVSLFERMIRNGLSCYTLNVQHRMRPEFASLIVPTIYSDLRNDISTYNRPDIKGVKHNLYFISHNQLEEQLIQSTSHVNSFEVSYVVSLARYLHLQGYNQEEITILATYTGQVQQIKKVAL